MVMEGPKAISGLLLFNKIWGIMRQRKVLGKRINNL